MSKTKAARPLAECLDADASMARLASHTKRLLNLQRCLEAAAPAALVRTCRVANYKLGVVFINADNGAVATKQRQVADGLGDEFRKRGTEVNEIRVKVQPRAGNPQPSDRKVGYGISGQSKRGLTSLTDRLPEDSPLKKSLRRLIDQAKEDTKG
jgi:hypothetical protein